MKITIREANLEDVPSIAEIHVTSWQVTYSGLIPEDYILSQTIERRTKLWTNVINESLASLLVAEENQKVIGFISFEKIQPDLSSQSIEISSIYLLPNHFNKGIGTKLLSECKSRLTGNKVNQITLWSLDTNISALKFYRKHGFVETGKQNKERLNGVVLNDVELSKPLN
ncbi:GNAT family N-acetyltransferase [Vibrio penaeicida]|uniref:GNAT family N-acetyltransferase n=1 Tax=Vibrio penaeicida TaxID=104609 RepID=UPI000CEA6AF9|nr:GNAT family N-acetyltransferase [Vibrio penaeicida]